MKARSRAIKTKKRSAPAGLLAFGLSLLLSCRQAEDPPQAPVAPPQAEEQAEERATAAPAASSEPGFDWAPYRNKCVIAEGYASGSKLGPRLQSGTFSIAIKLPEPPGDEAYWKIPGGSRIRVRGIVTERSDLPVFVPKKGEPQMQGMPVPEGTDLDKARRRYLIEQASVTQVRTVAEAEADLKAFVGQEVSLNGVIWSLNGHWWFNHDGVEVHVEGQDKIPGWTSMHGMPATLQGKLDRRALPRIDQIVMKPNRDLSDAFIVSLGRMTEHPPWSVTACPNDNDKK